MWQVTGTNLYYNHAESKHVGLPCNFIRSRENLRRGTCRNVSIGLGCGVYSTNDRSEPEIRQTSVAVVIDESIELAKGYR